MCVRERARQRVYVRVRERVRQRVCVREKETKRECVRERGSEGALTKGPFNMLSQVHDLNNALVSKT